MSESPDVIFPSNFFPSDFLISPSFLAIAIYLALYVCKLFCGRNQSLLGSTKRNYQRPPKRPAIYDAFLTFTLLMRTTSALDKIRNKDNSTTAEPAYSCIIFIRFLAVAELAPFVFIPLLFYPACNRIHL